MKGNIFGIIKEKQEGTRSEGKNGWDLVPSF